MPLNSLVLFQGATVAQARAALKQHKDVMEAAERIFDGSFDNVVDDDGDVDMMVSERTARKPRMIVRIFYTTHERPTTLRRLRMKTRMTMNHSETMRRRMVRASLEMTTSHSCGA